MIILRRFTILMLLATAALWVAPAFAGGWAVVTLDHLPEQVAAGQPVHVGFMVRQHGQNPLPGLKPTIYIQESGAFVGQWVDAVEDSQAGHYTATLVFPTAGAWQWRVETGFWPERQPMPDLVVAAGDATDAPVAEAEAASPLPYVLAAAGTLGLIGGGMLFVRTRSPWAGALALLAVAALSVGAGGIVLAAPQRAATATPAPAYSDVNVALGERLFVAKGCVVCHSHDAVADAKAAINFDYEDAKDLTDFSADPEYLARWLDNPASIKPATFMPRLNLSQPEIGALVAFINAP